MSFDLNGDLLAEPELELHHVEPEPDVAHCVLCDKELTTIVIGGYPQMVCPLHGSRGVPRVS